MARDSLSGGGEINVGARTPSQSRSQGRSHGRYTVVRKLAEGGMAEIFLGRAHGSEGFERQVVLKRIHTAFMADEQFRNMLIDEAHISMGLHHNNIVQVLDLGRAGGRLFLVLELIDGWDLQRIIERTQAVRYPLPLGLGLYIMADVCRALAYAHGRTRADGTPMGIVHRDVSPQNVLVSDQGEVKLADFGIAKAMTKRERTATGVVKGKVAFMSPEQALGQALDARTDIFSFGTMLYLVALGVRPFEAATDFEQIARVQRGVYTPPEEVRPDLSLALSSVIRRCLTLDREQRYQTADELLVDLEGIWRAEFGAPGATELKLWLADLGRVDGVLSIGRAPMRSTRHTGGASDLAEGQAVILGDESSAEHGTRQLAEELSGVDSDASGDQLGRLDSMASLEVVGGPSSDATYVLRPGEKATPGAGSAVSGIEDTSVNDLALPIEEVTGNAYREQTGRDVVPRTSRAVPIAFVAFVVVTVAAAALIWRAAGQGGANAGSQAGQRSARETQAAQEERAAKPAAATVPPAGSAASAPGAAGGIPTPKPAAEAPAEPARLEPARGGGAAAQRPARRPPPAPGTSTWSPFKTAPVEPPPAAELPSPPPAPAPVPAPAPTEPPAVVAPEPVQPPAAEPAPVAPAPTPAPAPIEAEKPEPAKPEPAKPAPENPELLPPSTATP
jgi:serine/threonine-protein kinase